MIKENKERIEINRLVDFLKGSKRLVIFTGAGMSTESGIPDFRSPNGVWSRYQPVYFQDFLKDESSRIRYWKMKLELFQTYRDVKPNFGHKAIVLLHAQRPLYGLITQNIDGLHQEAGISDENILEIHGSDRKVACLSCDYSCPTEKAMEEFEETYIPPNCPQCKGLLKSATISFGQNLDANLLSQCARFAKSCDRMLIIGSSLVVQPAAGLPELTLQNGGKIAILNREATPMDSYAEFRNSFPCAKTLHLAVQTLLSS